MIMSCSSISRCFRWPRLTPTFSTSDRCQSCFINRVCGLATSRLRRKFIERAAQEILLIDRQGDQITEEAVAELVDSGEVRRHANTGLEKIYAGRREKLAVMLRAELEGIIDFRLPDLRPRVLRGIRLLAVASRPAQGVLQQFDYRFFQAEVFSGKENGQSRHNHGWKVLPGWTIKAFAIRSGASKPRSAFDRNAFNSAGKNYRLDRIPSKNWITSRFHPSNTEEG